MTQWKLTPEQLRRDKQAIKEEQELWHMRVQTIKYARFAYINKRIDFDTFMHWYWRARY